MTIPISSGFVRGGANANPNWGSKYGSVVKATVEAVRKVVSEDIPKPTPNVGITLLDSEKAPALSRAQAVQLGFTGSTCNNCQSSRMKVSGHCEVCEDCGTTTGCS